MQCEIYEDDMWEELAKNYRQVSKNEKVSPIIIIEDNKQVLCNFMPNNKSNFRLLKIVNAAMQPTAINVINNLSIYEVQGNFEQLKSMNITPDQLKDMRRIDCMVSIRLDKNEEDLKIKIYPYEIDQQTKQITWLQSLDNYDLESLKKFNADTYNLLMSLKDKENKQENLFDILKKQFPELVDSEEQFQFMIRRLCVDYLISKDISVFDFFSKKHPEWTNAKEVAEEKVNQMFSDGLLPKQALTPIKQCCQKFMGTPEFFDEFKKVMSDNPAFFSEDMRNDDFIESFESECLYSKNNVEMFKALDSIMGVSKCIDHEKLIEGDKVDFLINNNFKKATYIGNVNICICLSEDSVLLSKNPEQSIEESPAAPEGFQKYKTNTPKFSIDETGEFVYGISSYYKRS